MGTASDQTQWDYELSRHECKQYSDQYEDLSCARKSSFYAVLTLSSAPIALWTGRLSFGLWGEMRRRQLAWAGADGNVVGSDCGTPAAVGKWQRTGCTPSTYSVGQVAVSFEHQVFRPPSRLLGACASTGEQRQWTAALGGLGAGAYAPTYAPALSSTVALPCYHRRTIVLPPSYHRGSVAPLSSHAASHKVGDKDSVLRL
jgi:hypothetical protein